MGEKGGGSLDRGVSYLVTDGRYCSLMLQGTE